MAGATVLLQLQQPTLGCLAPARCSPAVLVLVSCCADIPPFILSLKPPTPCPWSRPAVDQALSAAAETRPPAPHLARFHCHHPLPTSPPPPVTTTRQGAQRAAQRAAAGGPAFVWWQRRRRQPRREVPRHPGSGGGSQGDAAGAVPQVQWWFRWVEGWLLWAGEAERRRLHQACIMHRTACSS